VPKPNPMQVQTAPAGEPEPDPRIGVFVARGAVEAMFVGDVFDHAIFATNPGETRYRVDPATGRTTERIA
jgi:hypothetical protein